MILNDPLSQIFSNMIAGAAPNHDADPTLTVFYLAHESLQTDKLHFALSESDDRRTVFYMAVPSAALASVGPFSTPLAAALPGHPEHKGDGAYYLKNGISTVAVLKHENEFKCMYNNTDSLLDYLISLQITLHDVENCEPWTLESITGRHKRLADKVSSISIKIGAALSATSLLVGLGAAGVHTYLSTSTADWNAKQAANINKMIRTIDHTSPLSSQIARLQTVAATVVRAGGWIDEYTFKTGKETFSVSLPEWVTQDYIAALGVGTSADRDAANNLINVVKK